MLDNDNGQHVDAQYCLVDYIIILLSLLMVNDNKSWPELVSLLIGGSAMTLARPRLAFGD